VGLIAGILGGVVWELVKLAGEHSLIWALKQPYTMMGMDLPIGVWIVLAPAVILVAVPIAWHFLQLLFPQDQWPQAIFWLVVFVVISLLV
jgi:hypothetical protein